MKEINLSQGKIALVDDDFYPSLMTGRTWFAWYNKTADTFYAVRHHYIGEIRTVVYMHRIIVEADTGVLVDHKDHDGLNNQRSNLRVANASLNQANRRKSKGTSSPFKGVSWSKKDKVWVSQIFVGGKYRRLGAYQTERDAASAYDEAARFFFGEFALVNGEAV